MRTSENAPRKAAFELAHERLPQPRRARTGRDGPPELSVRERPPRSQPDRRFHQNLSDLTRQLTAAESEYARRQANWLLPRSEAPRLRRRGFGQEPRNHPPMPSSSSGKSRYCIPADIAGTLGEGHPKTQHLASELQEVRRKLSNEVDLAIDGLKNEVQIAGDQVHSIREQLAKLQAARGPAQEAGPRLHSSSAMRRRHASLGRPARAPGGVPRGAAALPDLRMLSVASPPDQPSSYSPLLFLPPSLTIFTIGGGFWRSPGAAGSRPAQRPGCQRRARYPLHRIIADPPQGQNAAA